MVERTESERRANLVLLAQRDPSVTANAFDTSALALADMEQPNIAYGRRHVMLDLAPSAFARPRAEPAPAAVTARAAGVLYRRATDEEGDDSPDDGDAPPRPPRRPITAATTLGVRAVVGSVDAQPAGAPSPPPPPPAPSPPPSPIAPALIIVERYRLTTFVRGFGLGDHLYSFTLFPEEEVEIEIKTWKTSEETAKAASSIFDGQSDQAESEFANAVEQENTANRKAESAHEAHVEASAEVSWGFGSASITAGASMSAAEASEHFARNMSNATQKVANKATRERRIEITQTNETKTTEGEETHTRRKIKNINKCRTLNYNYFQLLRKYETRLELYDLRLLFSSGEPYLDASTGSWSYETEEVPLADARRLVERVLVADAVAGCLAAVHRHVGPGTDDDPGLDVLADGARPARLVLDQVPLAAQIAWEDAVRASASAGLSAPPRPQARLPKLLSRDARIVATNAVYVEAMLGKCDACEDFVTDSRVLEIEARQLENRRAELELERLAVETAQRKLDPVERRAVSFEGLPAAADVHVYLDGDRTAAAPRPDS